MTNIAWTIQWTQLIVFTYSCTREFTEKKKHTHTQSIQYIKLNNYKQKPTNFYFSVTFKIDKRYLEHNNDDDSMKCGREFIQSMEIREEHSSGRCYAKLDSKWINEQKVSTHRFQITSEICNQTILTKRKNMILWVYAFLCVIIAHVWSNNRKVIVSSCKFSIVYISCTQLANACLLNAYDHMFCVFLLLFILLIIFHMSNWQVSVYSRLL